MNDVPTIQLKKGSAKPFHGGHPWVFADAIARIDNGNPAPGAEVRICDDRGACLGRGLFSPGSALAVRLFTREDAPVTTPLIAARIDEALALRRTLGLRTGQNGSSPDLYDRLRGSGFGSR